MVKNMYVARSNDTMYRYAFLWPSDLGNKMPFELLGCTCGKLLAEGLCITFLKSTYKKKKKDMILLYQQTVKGISGEKYKHKHTSDA
jgi:hypothetical protein